MLRRPRTKKSRKRQLRAKLARKVKRQTGRSLEFIQQYVWSRRAADNHPQSATESRP